MSSGLTDSASVARNSPYPTPPIGPSVPTAPRMMSPVTATASTERPGIVMGSPFSLTKVDGSLQLDFNANIPIVSPPEGSVSASVNSGLQAPGAFLKTNSMRMNKRPIGRQGSVRRNFDQQSHTFAMPNDSVTSPSALPLMSSLAVLPEGFPNRFGGAEDGVTSPTLSPPTSTVTSPVVIRSISDAIQHLRGPSDDVHHNLPHHNSTAVAAAKTIFCLFGSLERRMGFREMSDLFQRHRTILEPFYQEVLRIDKVFPPDFDFMHNLRHPEGVKDEFFSRPMAIWPLTTLFLIGCFLVTAKRVGYQTLYSALQEGGILMLGKGVFAALAVAESRNEEELIRNASRHFRAAFCVGIAYQRKELELQHLSVGCGEKSFSILVVNIPVSTLQLLIDQANNLNFGEGFGRLFPQATRHPSTVDGLTHSPTNLFTSDVMAPHSEIQISRVISERSAVVVAHPLDLMRLDMLLVKYADATGIKIHKDFLPTPVPENSNFFNQGLQYDVCRIWLDMDFSLEGSDLMVPIFSPHNGGELKVSTNLLMEIAGAVTCTPQDLTYSLQNLRDGDVLLDFSPSSMRLGQIIAWTRRDIVCLAEPSDRIEASILPSPRRSARKDLISSTLGKCAVIQEILNTFHWEHRPRNARVVQLSTSFITDLHMLIDLDNVPLTNNNEGLRSPDMSITSFPLVPLMPQRSGGSALNSPSHAFMSSPRGMSLAPRGSIPGHFSPPSSNISHFGGTTNMHPGGNMLHAVGSQRLVALPHAFNKQVINLYEVSPLIKYLELQHRCVLTKDAVEFAERLSRVSRLTFPPHTLLLCPTVLQLLELWDGLEFLQRLNQPTSERIHDEQQNRDAPPGVPGAAIRRRRQLKRATDLIYGSSAATRPQPYQPHH